MQDYPLTEDDRERVRAYREALRDLPAPGGLSLGRGSRGNAVARVAVPCVRNFAGCTRDASYGTTTLRRSSPPSGALLQPKIHLRLKTAPALRGMQKASCVRARVRACPLIPTGRVSGMRFQACFLKGIIRARCRFCPKGRLDAAPLRLLPGASGWRVGDSAGWHPAIPLPRRFFPFPDPPGAPELG